MEKIEAYKTSDGEVFEDAAEAKTHESLRRTKAKTRESLRRMKAGLKELCDAVIGCYPDDVAEEIFDNRKAFLKILSDD